MDRHRVTSTSRSSANCSDLVLRETKTTRIVFRPELVENPNDPAASVHGTFLYYQRKKTKDEWEDSQSIPLSTLKSGEGIKLELHADEILKLFRHLNDLYEIYEKEGIPLGQSEFIRVTSTFARVARLPQSDLQRLLDADRELGRNLLFGLLSWAINSDEPENLVQRLVSLGSTAFQKLNIALNLQSLKSALDIWESNEDCAKEEFWQETIAKHSFVLEHVFSWPTTIVKEKAYVGGKSVMNSGGNVVDFLTKNYLTNNAALVEIKTPVTRLLSRKEYRGSIFNISSELSGAVMQVLNYNHTLKSEYHSLTKGQRNLFSVFNPKCVVIIGNSGKELDSPEKKQALELFRRGGTEVAIITYDELFQKTRQLITVLEAPGVTK